ncbi:hypothetical protein AHF37_05037 [Paragonimus kellicotti]|nr:hypothetical protein AHF37_05037 [Paragonimus kellicotti]
MFKYDLPLWRVQPVNNMCNFPSTEFDLTLGGSSVFTYGHPYSIVSALYVPDSPKNNLAGIFLIFAKHTTYHQTIFCHCQMRRNHLFVRMTCEIFMCIHYHHPVRIQNKRTHKHYR